MTEEREKMDVYTGSDESEQVDMWLFVRGLRPQFDSIDNITLKRNRALHRIKHTGSGSDQGFWQKFTRHRPWQRQTRSVGARS